MVSVLAQAGVRVLPPMMALLVAVLAVSMEWSGSALLAAALIGYAAGAAWLLPALLRSWQIPQSKSTENVATAAGDDRSATLRMAHTLVDALLATAIVVVWQRLYGAQEAGWMAATLRMMGFVPAVVHMAWAQVLLAQPQYARTHPLWVGLTGFASVALLGAGCAVALEFGWLVEQWQGLWPYLLPLVLWQGSACVAAALSHLSFQSQSASKYSYICLGVATVQVGVLLSPFLLGIVIHAKSLINFLSYISSIGLLILVIWLYLKIQNESTD
jgi:hypothetical protein